MKEAPDGDYVRFEDVKALVVKLTATLSDATAAINMATHGCGLASLNSEVVDAHYATAYRIISADLANMTAECERLRARNQELVEALENAIAWSDRMAAKGNAPMQTWVVPGRTAIANARKLTEGQ
jgi:hypothetical protein